MANLPLPPQDKTLTRVDFDDVAFRRTIAQKGLPLTWFQAAECPCSPKSADLDMDLTNIVDVAESGTGHTTECPVCRGSGVLYHSGQEVMAIVTGAEDDFLNARFGGYREGLVNITVNPEHLPSFGDRFVFKNSVMIYRETVEITAADFYLLRFPIVSRELQLATGPANVDVLYAHRADAVTGLAVIGGTLTPGTDFEVIDDGISWINKPAVGSRVSFSYYINPSYVVVSYPNSIRDTQTLRKRPTEEFIALPVRVQAKLEFLELNDA